MASLGAAGASPGPPAPAWCRLELPARPVAPETTTGAADREVRAPVEGWCERQMDVMFAACGPLGPCVTSNWTFWFSSSER